MTPDSDLGNSASEVALSTLRGLKWRDSLLPAAGLGNCASEAALSKLQGLNWMASALLPAAAFV
eukprot:4439987-Pleurochrysis_carterae.AAC.2